MSVTQPTFEVSVNDLQPEHLSAFICTRRSILSTTLAEGTFAQIVDGLPTNDTTMRFMTYTKEIKNNTTSSAEAIDIARKLRTEFETLDTLFDVKVSSRRSRMILAHSDNLVVITNLPGRSTRVS